MDVTCWYLHVAAALMRMINMYLIRSGTLGTIVVFCPGDAEAGVVFDGENVEACERVLARDLEAVGVCFQADPDTPAQPVVAQLLSLLGALLQSDEVAQALKTTRREERSLDSRRIMWSRVLSQTLMAVLQLAVHCSDAVVAACQEGDVVAHVLPALLEVAIRPIQLPALLTAQVLFVMLLKTESARYSSFRASRGC